MLRGRFDGALEQLARRLPRAGSPLAFGLAMALVALAALARLPLDALAGRPLPPFITFSPTIIIVGLLCGIRAALLAAALALALAWRFWIDPFNSGDTHARYQQVTIGMFMVTSATMALASGGARLLLDRLAMMLSERSRNAKESVHRLRNLLAIMAAIVRRSASQNGSTGAMEQDLQGRLKSLGAAQDALIQADWNDITLKTLTEGALTPFRDGDLLTIEIAEDVPVPSGAVNGLTLALYELAANSLKYGALRHGRGGALHVLGKVRDGRRTLVWRERTAGLEAGAQTPGAGNGKSLIESALAQTPGGQVRYTVSGGDVVCEFSW